MRAWLLIARLGVLGVVQASCQAVDPLELPEVEGAQSAVLLIAPHDGVSRLLALDLAEPKGALSLSKDDPLFVVLYETPLETLGLVSGPVVTIGSNFDARPLPPSEHRYLAEGAKRHWRTISEEELIEAVGTRNLPDLPPDDCDALEGCFRSDGPLPTDFYCEVPCRGAETPALPMPPLPVEVPRFTTCPQGWSSLERPRDLMVCIPPDRLQCSEGTIQRASDAACQVLGSVCPPGRWPSDVPAGALFVDPSEPAGGDGTSERPLTLLTDALDIVLPGGTVVLSSGVHTAGVETFQDLLLIGTCAEDTRIASTNTAIHVAQGALTLRDVSVVSSAQGLSVGAGARLVLEGVHIEATGTGVSVENGGRLTGEAVRVESTQADAILAMGSAATVDLEGLSIDRAYGHGVLLLAGAEASLTNVAIQGVSGEASGSEAIGHGIMVRGTSSLILDDAYIVDPTGYHLAVWDDANARITDLMATGGTGPLETYAFHVLRGGQVMAERVGVRQTGGGAWVTSKGLLRLSDAWFEHMDRFAVFADEDGQVELSRVVMEGGAGAGLRVRSGRMEAFDVRLEGLPEAEGEPPVGDAVFSLGAEALHLDRFEIRSVVRAAEIYGPDDQGDVVLSNWDVEGVTHGILLSGETHAEVSRAWIRNIENDAMEFSVKETAVTLEDIDVEAVRRGLFFSDGQFVADRVRVVDAQLEGVRVYRSTVTISDLTMRGDGSSDTGLYALGTSDIQLGIQLSDVSLSGFRFEGAASTGVQIRNFVDMRLTAGRMVDLPIGIDSSGQPGFDVAGALNDVVFERTETPVKY